jgi:putative ABC transport system ATP-binding protein
MPGAEVVVEHVSHVRGGNQILNDISLMLEPGELVALTGPSGSGKTTLLQLIGSLERPTSGSIRVDGTAVDQLRNPVRFRRTVVGFVFQLHHLLQDLNVQENVELTLVATGVPRRERERRARALIAEVGLAGREHARPAELSGGERQRVAIARAIAAEPRLLLADEPTGALDLDASRRVWQLLREVRQRYGTTIFVASHDPTLTEHVDRGLAIAGGRLVDSASGPAEAAPADVSS